MEFLTKLKPLTSQTKECPLARRRSNPTMSVLPSQAYLSAAPTLKARQTLRRISLPSLSRSTFPSRSGPTVYTYPVLRTLLSGE
uniref:Uncharacterized protein n=1 Tax=Paramormyrops kingsleyae TaxID=1676925 RepID=A0A3B3T5S1_9TELE